MSSNAEDTQKSGKEEQGKQSGGRMQKAKDAVEKSKKKFKIIKFLLNPAGIGIITTILIILLLIGFLSFFTAMPGLVWDKITEITSELWTEFQYFFTGDNRFKITDESMVDLATYLENMGYDLTGYGFVVPEIKYNDDGTINNDKTMETVLERDEETDGIKKIKSEYLFAYLLSDYNTYSVDPNSHTGTWLDEAWENNTEKILNTIRILFKWFSGKSASTGMLYIGTFDTYLHGSVGVKSIDRANKEIILEVDEGIKYFGGKTYWRVNLDGWAGRYGKPLELLLTLHLATMAPDLPYAIATEPEFNTKVYIEFYDVATSYKLSYHVSNLNSNILNTFLSVKEFEGLLSDDDYILDASDINTIVDYYDTIKDDHIEQIEVAIDDSIEKINNYKNVVDAQEIEENVYDILNQDFIDSVIYSPNYIISDCDATSNHHLSQLIVCLENKLEEIRNSDSTTISPKHEIDYYTGKLNEVIACLRDATSGTIIDNSISNRQDSLDKAIELLKKLKEKTSEETANISEEQQKVNNALDAIGVSLDALRESQEVNNGNLGKTQGTSSYAYIPYITHTEKAWFRDVYFIDDDGYNAYADSEATETSVYAYQPEKEITNIESNKENGPWYVTEIRSGNFKTQVSEPKIGETNAATKKLFVGDNKSSKSGTSPYPKYYIYDGTVGTAIEIARIKELEESLRKNQDYSESEIEAAIEAEDTKDVYREISLSQSSLTAFSILENVGTEDADYILRDLKELLIELEYFTEDDFKTPNTAVLDWLIPDYTPDSWPVRTSIDEQTEYGTYIRAESGSESANSTYNTGFEEGLDVITPGTGEVTRVGTDYIEIKFTEERVKNPDTDSDEKEIDNPVLEYTMYITGFNVDSSIKVGDVLEQKEEDNEKQVIGTTKATDIKVILRDEKNSVIHNVEDYMCPTEEKASANLGSNNEVANIVWAFLVGEKELDIVQATGIMANMYKESRFNTSAENSIGAIGLCQWLDRGQALKNYANSQGKDWTDVYVQLEFFWSEFSWEADRNGTGANFQWKSGYNGSYYQTFINTTDVSLAITTFCDAWERAEGSQSATVQNPSSEAQSRVPWRIRIL